MTKNWLAINLALLALTALLAWQLNVTVLRFNNDNKLSRIQPVRDLKQKITADGGLPAPQPYPAINPVDFSVIAANNLFSESRTKEEKVEQVAAPVEPPLTVKPILVGVTISGNQRYVAIIDPAAGANNKRAQIKQLGDTYAGYTITDITGDAMVLEFGSRREVIPLHDVAKPAQVGKTPILPTRVVSFGGGVPSQGTGVSQQALIPPNVGPQRTPTQGVVSSSIGSASPSGPSGISRATPGRPTPGAPQAPPNWNQTTDDQGRRVIRTPFGDVIQDRPPNP